MTSPGSPFPSWTASSSRRTFLAVGLTSVTQAVLPATRGAATEMHAHRRSWHALGSSVHLTLFHRDQAIAEEALDQAQATLDQIEQCFSLYREGSEIRRLNETGQLSTPHTWWLTLLNEAELIYQQSAGAFDPTVQPLWHLFKAAQGTAVPPSPESILKARALVDWRQLTVEAERISFRKPNMALTLNGIAQGFAADQIAEVIERHGIEHALVDCGELHPVGLRPEGQAWKVGIQHPRHQNAFLGLAKLKGRCLATSGDYATTFSDDFTSHHVFDPGTGASPKELASVSVLAPNATRADALSTTLMILGVERSLALIKKLPHTDALMVTKTGKVMATPGFPWSTS